MPFLSHPGLRDPQPASAAAISDTGHPRTSPLLPLSAAAHRPAAIHPGRVHLDAARLRELRQTRLMSQQDLADDFWRRNVQVSIATIKRAETGQAVRYRVARELARYFDLAPEQLVGTASPAAVM